MDGSVVVRREGGRSPEHLLGLFFDRIREVERATHDATAAIGGVEDAVGRQTEVIRRAANALLGEVAQVQTVLGRIAEALREARDAQLVVQRANLDISRQILAIQQSLIARDDTQRDVEEFLFRLQKLVRAVETHSGVADPVANYYLLEGMLRRVEDEGIATPMIRGIENKTLFDDCLTRAREAHARLAEVREVRDAIAWAEEQARRAEEAEAVARTAREEAEAAARMLREEAEANARRVREEAAAATRMLWERRARLLAGKPYSPDRPTPGAYQYSFLKYYFSSGTKEITPRQWLMMQEEFPGVIPGITDVQDMSHKYCSAGDSTLRQNAYILQTMQRLLDHFYILTMTVEDRDSPDFPPLLEMAEAVGYGDRVGGGEFEKWKQSMGVAGRVALKLYSLSSIMTEPPPGISADHLSTLARLLSEQPWARSHASALAERGVNTLDGVWRELVTFAASRGRILRSV